MVDWLWGMDQFYMGWSKDYWKAKGQDGYASHPIGTGPFHFIKWGSGSLTYERVEDHWRSDPIMDRAVFVGTSEAQTRAALVQTGGAHISDVIPLDMAQDAEKAGVNLVVFPGFFNIRYHFGGHRLDPWNDPWADPKVRKAIALAVDVDAMSEEFWGGHAIPLVAPVATSLFNAEPYGYDPEEAKRLLAEAGYPNGFEVEVPMITVGGNPRVPLEHNSLLTFLENIGLKVKGTVYDWTGGWSQRWGEGDTGGMIFGFSITRFDSAQREWDWYGRTPRSIWQDATLTDILTRMDQPYLTDLEEFDKLQVEAWHYLYDIVGVIPLYATPVFDLLSGDLTMPKEVMTPQRVRLDFIEFAK
jgi:ABC-type transport system substrate-binding protein